MISPSNVGIIDGWASYEDVLDGQPIFMTKFDVLKDKTKDMCGTIATEATKRAVVQGADYFWTGRAVSASLLWRTERDYESVRGWSGSVLCLGKPKDPKVKAVVFQNYERQIKTSQLQGERKLYEPSIHDNQRWFSSSGRDPEQYDSPECG